jgi:hypothetical protein
LRHPRPVVRTAQPAIARSLRPTAYTSLSHEAAELAKPVCRHADKASWGLFFTGENTRKRSISVYPTRAVAGRSKGRSCIMHSSRTGEANSAVAAPAAAAAAPGANLGLANSGTSPPDAARVRASLAHLNTKMLTPPGKGEWPVSSGTSPCPVEASSNGPSWLYSMHRVRSTPWASAMPHTAPTASPALRATATMFMSRSLRADAPTAATTPRNASALVSWNMTTHRTPRLDLQ